MKKNIKKRNIYRALPLLALVGLVSLTGCARKTPTPVADEGGEGGHQYETYFPNVDRGTLIDPRSVADERNIGKKPTSPDTGIKVGSTTRIKANRYELEGVLRVITKTSVNLENFSYNGTCPGINLYLTRSNNDKLKVVPLDIQNRRYDNENLTFYFPSGVTTSDINSIAMICANKEDPIFVETIN